MIRIVQIIGILIVFLILEYSVITITIIEFKRVLMKELENINFVTEKEPHPLKRFFISHRIFLILLCFITVLVMPCLAKLMHFNPIYIIGILIVFKSGSYVFYKNRPTVLSFDEQIKFSQCFREDYTHFVNMLSTQTLSELMGLALGVITLIVYYILKF